MGFQKAGDLLIWVTISTSRGNLLHGYSCYSVVATLSVNIFKWWNTIDLPVAMEPWITADFTIMRSDETCHKY